MITEDSAAQIQGEGDKSSLREDVMKDFINALRSTMSTQFNNNLNESKVEFYADGVIDKKGSTIVVKLPFSTLPVEVDDPELGEGIPNCTGAELVPKNKVRVFYGKHNMKDAYVGVILSNE